MDDEATDNATPNPTPMPAQDSGIPRSASLTDRLENDFTYHPPKGTQQARYEALRRQGKALAYEITRMVPESREQSLALTNLEMAVFWANAGIARNE